ncbi:hypothetical protein [Nibribacter koreensis]|uniref:Uncharacterized protein n=1 Tax=Nibribacter koreensis TaxID=1084519 RepID=A0ABP8FBP7_9BACT
MAYGDRRYDRDPRRNWQGLLFFAAIMAVVIAAMKLWEWLGW